MFKTCFSIQNVSEIEVNLKKLDYKTLLKVISFNVPNKSKIIFNHISFKVTILFFFLVKMDKLKQEKMQSHNYECIVHVLHNDIAIN